MLSVSKLKLYECVDINPRESLAKGTMAKKISMDVLQPFYRDVPSFELSEYNGGTKFRNGDIIMARITPCLENGEIALVNILVYKRNCLRCYSRIKQSME